MLYKCSCCKEEKPFEAFSPRKDAKRGVKSRCKICENLNWASRASHPEFRAKQVARARKRRETQTPEKYKFLLEQGKAYAKRNPHILLKNTRARQARILRATPKWADGEFEQFHIAEMYHLSSLRKQVLNVEFNVDHIVPLKSDFVCGLHCASNLRIITAAENKAKLNLHWPDMW